MPHTANNEEWRDVPGYEGHYQVSNQGRVKSLNRTVHGKDGKTYPIRERIRKASTDKFGYQIVSLSKDGIVRVRSIHSLVAAAFHGPRPAGMEIRHLNGNPADNRPENLRYGTSSENSYDTVAHGRNEKANRTHCPRGHELGTPNLVPRALKRGTRTCLACSRARAHVHYHKDRKPHLQEISDNYHEVILAEARTLAMSH